MDAYQGARLHALADATRRAILERLLRGPAAVGELARGFPVSRPAVSQHLRVLKEAGLVAAAPEGSRRLYRLDPEGFDSLREYLDQFWTRALTAFKKRAEERPKGRGDDDSGSIQVRRTGLQDDRRQDERRARVPRVHPRHR